MVKLNNFYIAESVDFMKKNIQDNYIDLTITSPPYDDLRKYNGFIFNYKEMLNELYRVTKDGGVVVWVTGDKTEKGSETLTSFKHALYAKEIGFNIHDTMIYMSDKPPLSHNRYEQKFEYMFIFSKGKPSAFNPIMEECKYAGSSKRARTFRQTGEDLMQTHDMGCVKNTKIKGNVWTYTTGYQKSTKDKIAFKHPAIFPEKLALDHILSWSNENDIIFDPMCGSGSVCKMAYLSNRNFIGIDISDEYINDICKPRLIEYGLKF